MSSVTLGSKRRGELRYRDIRGRGGDAVYRYTASLEHDREIADLVGLVASAHLLSLVKAGLI
ncbi:MAG: hypothetical protein QI199_09080, partial [Candidatus Korarchaeota archaeon]|nr:hypothetical protein [Candidatus Korarchaeota archaeon]